MNRNIIFYYFKRSFFAVLLPLLIALPSIAQNNNLDITGKVYDGKTGVGLPGATVHLKNTTHEVVTDKDGRFRFLTGQKLPVVLIVTYIGYQTREVSENVSRNIDIALKETTSQLNDVVVVGYGTQRKRDLTSAIATIKGSEVTGTPVA